MEDFKPLGFEWSIERYPELEKPILFDLRHTDENGHRVHIFILWGGVDGQVHGNSRGVNGGAVLVEGRDDDLIKEVRAACSKSSCSLIEYERME